MRPRASRGSRDARRLRRNGLVPGVLYGGGDGPRAICIAERDLRHALTGAGGLHTVLDVVLEGETKAHPSVLKDFQQDPLRGALTHVDLHEVRLDQPIHASVSVALVGEPAGADLGGVLTHVTRDVNIEALPTRIPDHLEVDVSPLGLGESLRLADVPAPDGITFLDDPEETVIATVAQPTRVEEPEEMLEEGEEVTGVPTGEQAPQTGAEAPLEPGADAAGSPGTAGG